MSNKKSVCIALGLFDGVHIGHKVVIEKAREISNKLGCKLVVFSFDGDLRFKLNCDNKGVVYTCFERELIYKSLGADEAFFAPVSKEFLSKDKKQFLDYINGIFDIKCYVAGSEYSFGFNAQGNVEYLKEYALSRAQSVHIEPHVIGDNDNKVSTTEIKKFLSNGEIEKANAMLCTPYFVLGKVVNCRNVGKKIGYPTANIEIDEQKLALPIGVYYGGSVIDGVTYKAMINYGARPTFNLDKKVIEAHFIGFDGDLYGREIKIDFYKKIRDIKKFNDVNGLVKQLDTDKKNILEGLYD